MAEPVKPVPDRYHTLTPTLVCRDAGAAIDFYKRVFGAAELMRMPGPGGKIMHSELKVGDCIFFVNDSMSKIPPALPAAGVSNPTYLHVYVPDVDKVFSAAVSGGARVEMPVQDMFWGDRYGKLTDPFGQQWGVATHKEDVSPEEMAKRQQTFFTKAGGGA